MGGRMGAARTWAGSGGVRSAGRDAPRRIRSPAYTLEIDDIAATPCSCARAAHWSGREGGPLAFRGASAAVEPYLEPSAVRLQTLRNVLSPLALRARRAASSRPADRAGDGGGARRGGSMIKPRGDGVTSGAPLAAPLSALLGGGRADDRTRHVIKVPKSWDLAPERSRYPEQVPSRNWCPNQFHEQSEPARCAQSRSQNQFHEQSGRAGIMKQDINSKQG